MKILYVEDEISHVELTQRTLEDNLKERFVLLHRDSYQGAIQLLKEEPDIDIVLSDLRLPDGSGLDLLKEIREMFPPPAVVLVTGQGDEQVAVAALKAGAADYLVKQSDYLHRLPIVITNAVAQNNLAREQAAKREAEVKYQYLVEQIPAVVFLDGIDEHETPLYINPRVEELTGYTPEEWHSDQKIWENSIHPDEKERILELTKKTHAQGTPFQEEYRFIRRDGRVIWIKEDTNLIRDTEGNPLYWQGILIDITKEKENEDALQRQLKELTVLNAVTAAGTESTSEYEIIERFVRISSIIYNEVCGVLLLNHQGDMLTPHPSYYGANVTNWQFGTPITMGVTGRCVIEERAIRFGNVTKEPVYIEIATGIQSELCVPIRVNKRIIGVFNVESRKPNAFDAEDEQFLTTVTGNLGTALERLRLFRQEQVRAKELNALYQATKTLSLNLKPDVIAKSLLEIMDSLLGYEYASIYLLDEQENFLVPLAINPKSDILEIYDRELEALYTEKRSLGQGIIGWVAQHGQAIRSGDVSTEERYLPVIKNIRSELCVPIVIRERVIGAVNIETTTAYAYSERDENLLTALANSVAIALENAKLYQEALRTSERRAVLHRISQDIVRFAQDPEQVYKAIHEAAEKLMSCDVFMIAIRNEATNENMYVYTMEAGIRQTFIKKAAHEGLAGKVINTGDSIIIKDNASIDTGGYLHFGSPTHVCSVVAVPMRIGDKIIGMISAQSYKPNSYGDEEQALLEMLATHAATAIENTRLYNETQRRLKEMETIDRVSSALRLTQSQTQMYNILINETLNILDTKHASVWIFKPSINRLVLRAARGFDENIKYRQLKPAEGIVGRVFLTGEDHISSNLKTDPYLFEGNRDSIPEGYGGAAIPIQSYDGILGVLTVKLETNRQVSDHINLLKTLAEIAGNSIHRADLFDQSQEQVRRLTTLRDIDAAISSSTDLRVTLNILTDHALKHLKADAVDILIYHPELQSLTFLCSAGFNAPSPSRPLMRIGEGVAGQVVMNGRIEQIQDLRETKNGNRDPLLVREGFVSYIGVPLIVKGQIKGVFEIFHRSLFSPDNDWMQFMQTLAGQAAIAIDNSSLFDNLQRSNQELKQAYDTTLEGWSHALELRDRETEGHARRVTELTIKLARYVGIAEDELENIYRGVLLHDIGKMGVPDNILRKTGSLTEQEWVEMRRHPQYAFDLLSPIPYLRPALDIPYCHHEHWDGSGYPRGLKGEQIPLSARLFAAVDIWDALLSDRPYRKAWTREKVFKYMKKIAGTILDPRIVPIFLKMIEEEGIKTG